MTVVERKKAANYLTFASANPFTIAVYNAKKNWNGTLYFSTDAANWNEWDGTTTIASAVHGGEQKIYVRGSNNSFMTGERLFDTPDCHWVINGVSIAVTRFRIAAARLSWGSGLLPLFFLRLLMVLTSFP